MRRSSTTVSGPATVRLRRYGEKLLQNSSDSTRPSAPATIRMTPTVLRLNPEVVTSTAKVKMAPTTNRKILTPRLKAARLLQDASTADRSPNPACMGYLVRPCAQHCCYGSRRQRGQGQAGAAGSVAGRERPHRMQSSVPSAPPCCRQAVAIRYNTMLRGAPCPGAWLVINNVMVAPGTPWTPDRNRWWEVGAGSPGT